MIELIINLTPVTKKNHQQIKRKGRGGTPFIGQSEVYKQYEEAAMYFIRQQYKVSAIESPVNVKCIYYMPTKRRVDLCNLHAACHDVLVKAGVLQDDNCNILVSTDGSRVKYDSKNARTEIFITDADMEV